MALLEPKHMMYWKLFDYLVVPLRCNLEPKHMMYWKIARYAFTTEKRLLEPKHMMYWKTSREIYSLSQSFLNQNIWCIESLIESKLLEKEISWTKTYDVLKDYITPTDNNFVFLNQNIWCIESNTVIINH